MASVINSEKPPRVFRHRKITNCSALLSLSIFGVCWFRKLESASMNGNRPTKKSPILVNNYTTDPRGSNQRPFNIWNFGSDGGVHQFGFLHVEPLSSKYDTWVACSGLTTYAFFAASAHGSAYQSKLLSFQWNTESLV